MATQATVPVYEWHDATGFWLGVGTEAEFNHWRDTLPADAKLALLVGHEDAAEDERRRAKWAEQSA